MIQAVDSTARLFAFTETRHGEYSKGYHNSLSLYYFTDLHDHVQEIELLLEDSPKSIEFKRIEGVLTPALRRIDPHITIDTGRVSNPMM